jgi:hypothetical protein
MGVEEVLKMEKVEVKGIKKELIEIVIFNFHN